MFLKEGIVVQGVQVELVLALFAVDAVWAANKLPEPTITSCLDGKHSITSLHYAGAAIDLRTRDWPASIDKAAIVKQLKSRLTLDYDVILETDHIHLEYQPHMPR